MDFLEKIRSLIGLERLYYGLINQDLISYAYQADGRAEGIEPNYWNTAAGRDVLSSSGIVDFNGHPSKIIVSIPYELIRSLSAQASFTKDQDNPSPDAAAAGAKPISEADLRKAAELLRAKTLTERLTRPQQEEFLRQSFPDRHFTARQILSIFREVKVKIGRPQKPDNKI